MISIRTVIFVLLLALSSAFGCGGETNDDSESEEPAITDTDVDTDSDADSDTDADSDADSDSNTDATTVKSIVINANGFSFDALEIGPADGEPVLLLHGFPDTSLMWTDLLPVLAENGFHCIAPDQRGYSPNARPTEESAYEYAELIADAFAFGDELGEQFHLVAHDWGANIGWLMLEQNPSRIASYTAISIPHYRVWAEAVYEDAGMAWYLDMLNTWMTPVVGEEYWSAQRMRDIWSAKPVDQREATIEHMTQPGAMTAALNWYRASNGHQSVLNDFENWSVNVPTLLIFGSTDLGGNSVASIAPLMTGFYRLAQPSGGHFIVDEQPQAVADDILTHLQTHLETDSDFD
ncbi:MAG: alpha/beta hydrolase [Deltaproteobacteria bacterium]|nr:alpha/beta hydrolase [Deltaproteobacteria bacterium]